MFNLDQAIAALVREEEDDEPLTEEEVRALARSFHLTPGETEQLVLISQGPIGP